MNERMQEILTPLGVDCVDASEVRKHCPARILNGWELKPYAILHCPFEEVLLLDADNMAVTQPEFLFETIQYQTTGALFWPDFGRLEPTREIWKICGVAYQDEPEFESGQIVVNKRRCWTALLLCMWYNEYSDFFYRFIHGDKETFHLAFRRLGQPYAMPARLVEYNYSAGVIHQFDFSGNLLFVHQRKWDYYLTDKSDGFPFAAECQEYLEELRRKWDGSIDIGDTGKQIDNPALVWILTSTLYIYHRNGFDARSMSFSVDGTIATGADECERTWRLLEEGEVKLLEIWGDSNLTCRLQEENGMWRGEWLHSERMPINLIPSTASMSSAEEYIETFLPPSGRRAGFSAALKALLKLDQSARVIVEIGSIRDPRWRARQEDGWSTVSFGWFTDHFGAEFHSVDCSEFVSRNSGRVTRYIPDAVHYHVQEGIDFLKHFTKPIALLYLDTWGTSGSPTEEEFFRAILNLPHKPKLLLMDDYQASDGFCQGKWLADNALANGYDVSFIRDGQICLHLNIFNARQKIK